MDIELIVSVVGVAILCFAAVLINSYQARRTKSEAEEAITAAITASQTEIRNAVTPHVTFCSSIDQVRYEAASLISRAAQLFKDAVDANARSFSESNDNQVVISQFFITIYGSASLGNESDAGRSLDAEERQRSIDTYNEALAEAAAKQIQFRRYVSLMPDQEITSRSSEIAKEYIGWFETQLEQIKRDPNYTLIISPRAPQWGTSNTTFITRDAMIEVKGHGRAAIVIEDTRIAVSMRESLKSDVYGALSKNRREINRGNPDSIVWLEERLEGTKKVLGV